MLVVAVLPHQLSTEKVKISNGTAATRPRVKTVGKVKILEEELSEGKLGSRICGWGSINGEGLESGSISARMRSDPGPDPLIAPLLFAEEEKQLGKANLTRGSRFFLGRRELLKWVEGEKRAVMRRVRRSGGGGGGRVVVIVRTHWRGLT